MRFYFKKCLVLSVLIIEATIALGQNRNKNEKVYGYIYYVNKYTVFFIPTDKIKQDTPYYYFYKCDTLKAYNVGYSEEQLNFSPSDDKLKVKYTFTANTLSQYNKSLNDSISVVIIPVKIMYYASNDDLFKSFDFKNSYELFFNSDHKTTVQYQGGKSFIKKIIKIYK